MYGWMDVCLYVCLYVCMYPSIHLSIYPSIHLSIYVSMYIHIIYIHYSIVQVSNVGTIGICPIIVDNQCPKVPKP